jgi:heme-degrading monooxygenase HmoA
MFAVIFEVEPMPGRAEEYLTMAQALRTELEAIDGFISVERFTSVTNEGKFVSLSFWRTEEAVQRWRVHAGHQFAQGQGRDAIFRGYRIRVARVERDYGMIERAEAPAREVPSWGKAFRFE